MDLKMEIGFILEKSTKGKQMNNKTGLRGDPGSYRRGRKTEGKDGGLQASGHFICS